MKYSEVKKINDKTVGIMVDALGIPTKKVNYKVLIQLEPPEVINIVDQIISQHKNYDLIIAWNEKILNSCENAVYVPFGTCWVQNLLGVELDKQPELSYIMSSKRMTSGHKLRHKIWNTLNSYNGPLSLNRFMSDGNNNLPDKCPLYEHASYSIVVENSRIANYFSEKIIDAFATRTIPLYWGCTNINDFFLSDGIITFGDIGELKQILKTLDMEEYDKKKDVIEENYKRAITYINFWERIDTEITKFIDTH